MENCKNRQRLMDQDTRSGAVHTEGGFYNAGDAGRGEGPSPAEKSDSDGGETGADNEKRVP